MARKFVSAALAFLAIIFVAFRGANCLPVRGSLPLDSLTFDKVIGQFKAVLVKFDEAFPYGEKQEEYKEVAARGSSQPELIIAEVGISDYTEDGSKELAARFGVTAEDRPAYKLFLADRDEPIGYEGAVRSADILQFVREQTGLWIGREGCLERLDALAGVFVLVGASEKEALAEAAEQAAAGLTTEEERKSAAIYAQVMRRTLERGEGFPEAEARRVENLLRGKLTSAKKKLFQTKLNILFSFGAAVNAKEEL